MVARILAGDREAATWLFRRHLEGVYAFVYWRVGGRRHAAEDVTQEAFLDAWRNLDRFDRKREFWPWLCGIAKRKIARFYRAAGRTTREVAVRLESAEPSPSTHVEGRETSETVGRALSTLRPSHRELLLDKYVEHKSLAAIGLERGLSEAAVSSGLQRARQALREALSIEGMEVAHER